MVYQSIWHTRLIAICCLGVLAWIPGEYLFAQKSLLRTEFYSVDEGLPDRQVNSIIQDEAGFLWLGTPNGLSRFDGYEFLTFNDHPDNIYSISRSDVGRLFLDKHGNLVITYQNVPYLFDILNPHDQRSFQVNVLEEIGKEGHPRALHVSREGEIFLLSSTEEHGVFLYHYDSKTNEFQLVFQHKELQDLGATFNFVQLADSTFLLNDNNNGLRHFSREGALLNQLTEEVLGSFPQPVPYPATVNFMHRDVNGVVWMALANTPAVLRYHPETGMIERVKGLPPRGSYQEIWEDRTGNLLLADSEINRVRVYDTRRLYCFEPDGEMHDFSQLIEVNNRINYIYGENFFKTVYLGHESGMSVVQNNRPKVTTYLAQNMLESRRGARMRGVVADGKGLVYFAQESGGWYVLDHDINYLDTLSIIDRETGRPIPTGCALDLKLDTLGNLWGISCDGSGNGQLLRLDLADCLTDSFSTEYIFTAMEQAGDGNFWLAGWQRNIGYTLLQFDTTRKEFTPFLDPNGQNPLRDYQAQYILEGINGFIWIGTHDGLFRVDPGTHAFDHYRHQRPGDSIQFSNNTIYVIHQDTIGKLWLGTRNGVNIFNPETLEVQIIDKRNGLPYNIVCGILPDETGNYWISTYNGLAYYEPSRGQCRNFFRADGFSHDEFNRFSFARDPYNGRLYFGGMNGMNAFFQPELLDIEPPPPVVITRLTRYNSRRDSLISTCTMMCHLPEVEISPYDIYFQFNFMLPNFTSPNRNRYAAWLEGYEKDWLDLGTNPNIRYSKLPPGNYTLHLKGADPNGNWSTEEVSVDIRVKPIFYKTWWFLLIAALTTITLLYGWIKYRLEQKLKVERLRTKISSDLHDEVSGLLGGIAMQTDLLQEMVDNFESRHQLKMIGEKIRKAMSKMSDVIWSIDSRNDKLDDLLLRMHEHADEVLNGLDVHYEFHIGNLDRQTKMPVKIRQELYFIFKEAINNIAKHSNASKVDIHIGNRSNQFEMVIHDNGKAKEQTRTRKSGQGLSNIRMRAKRIKADLDIFNGDGYTINITMKRFA